MEREYGLYINGAECPGGAGVEEAICPYTEQPWTTVSQASEDDVRKAIEAARQAFESWKIVPGVKRAKLILRLADLIGKRDEHCPSSRHYDVAQWNCQSMMQYSNVQPEEEAEELSRLETMDNGKIRRETKS